MTCVCPPGAAIPDIEVSSCPFDLGQVQKVVFQRIYSATGVKNSITDPTLLASWTPLLAATDGTKAITSPFIANPTFEPGGAREYGGDNETPGGIPILLGNEPTKFTGMFLQQNQKETIKPLKELKCEEIGVYYIFLNGTIAAIEDEDTPGTYYPIPVHSFLVGDLNPGDYSNVASNSVEWSHTQNWADDLNKITPADFNAITDLVKPEAP